MRRPDGVAPSILAADFARLGAQVAAVLDIRTIVECSPQFGHTEASSKRRRQFTQR